MKHEQSRKTLSRTEDTRVESSAVSGSRCAFRAALLAALGGPSSPGGHSCSVNSRRALGHGGRVELGARCGGGTAGLRSVSDTAPCGPSLARLRKGWIRCLSEPSVSRILFPPLVARGRAMIIYLATTIARRGRATYPEASDGPSSSASLFGLAPCGVYPASDVTTRAVRSYRTISPLPPRFRRGGMFSVALSFPSPGLGVTQRTALGSSDFPPT